jgi:hypothetical protein
MGLFYSISFFNHRLRQLISLPATINNLSQPVTTRYTFQFHTTVVKIDAHHVEYSLAYSSVMGLEMELKHGIISSGVFGANSHAQLENGAPSFSLLQKLLFNYRNSRRRPLAETQL